MSEDKPKTSYLPETRDPLLDTTVAGRYLVQKKLGEGGMGSVYLALHTILEKRVALKVLHGEFARKPELVERFMQEAKAASRIQHEHVIDISDFGTTDGLVFFAMELLQGHDLHEVIARARLAGELLPWARTKKIFLQIASALAAAHAKGIVHRDMKPENVYLVEFLGDPDFVKLLDFGIAKLTEVANEEGGRKLTKTGMLFGTPEYMSPEQARGEAVDHRVDVYAMGCMLFQLVTGRVPFEADNFMGVLSLHLTEPPPAIPPEVFDQIGAPRELAAVIDRALAKDRDERWQTMDELAGAVRDVCGDEAPAAGATASLPASVPVPPGGTTRMRQATGPMSSSVRRREPTARQRTEWTGALKVPEVPDEPPRPPPRSRAPLAVGAVIAIAAGAGGVYLFTHDGSRGAPAAQAQPGSAELAGSGVVGAAGSATPAEVTSPGPAPAAPASAAGTAPAPAQAQHAELVLDSLPRGAAVTDLATGRELGKTPVHYEVERSATPRRFTFHLHGFADATYAVVPDRASVSHVEKLGQGGGTPASTTASGSAAGSESGSGSPVSAPDTGAPDTSGVVTHPDLSGSAAAPSPPPPAAPAPAAGSGSATKAKAGSGAKCNDEDVPCLKSFGSGS